MKKLLASILALLFLMTAFAGSALAATNSGISEVSTTDPGAIGIARATARVNVRSGPSSSYAIIGRLEKGEDVAIEALSGAWGVLYYSSGAGPKRAYVNMDYLKFEKADNPTIATLYTTEPVNMRKGPSTEYDVIRELPKGARVEKTRGIGSNWTQVFYGDEIGYVFSKYLTSKAPASAPESATGATATATGKVNLRSGPGTSYKKLGQIKKGETLELVGIQGSWIIVNWEGGTAFASKQYFKLSGTPSQQPASLSAAELRDMLQESGFLAKHKDTLMGAWFEGDTLHLRIKSSENVSKFGDKIRKELGTGTAGGKIFVHRSSLPRTVDAAYLNQLGSDIYARFEKLTRAQQESIGLASANYDAKADQFIVRLVGLDSAKERNFKRYLSDWQHITFERASDLDVPMT